MKKIILIALLALLLVVSIVLAATIDLWANEATVDGAGFLLRGQNNKLLQAFVGLAVFVILGLFGVIYKGPRR